ncbi:MAG: DNA/RNA nuclease SfsA [Bdellovibrionales bacterium]
MKFKGKLVEGTLLQRYKRFFADVKIGSKTILAHVPNSGSMKGCKEPGSLCRVTHNPDPKRKLQYTLEMVQTSTSWVGVNTSHPNKLVMELWMLKKVKHWKNLDRAQAEVKISNESRIDFVMWNSKDCGEERLQKYDFKKTKSCFHFVEVKNVSLAENGVALFPDSVTERGQKHLRELMVLKKLGHTSEILFVIQRQDCKSFSPADDIDPEYGKLLREAIQAGVQATALVCDLSDEGIELLPKPLKIKI